MKTGSELAQISKHLKEAKSMIICLPTQLPIDAFAGGLALFLGLQASRKMVSIACAKPIDPQLNLPGQHLVTNAFSADGDTLMVSIPLTVGSVDNVTYTIEGEKVNIFIKPQSGMERFDQKHISYNYTGGKPDLIVCIYSPTLAALGDLYEKNTELFQGVPTINIDRHFTNGMYGTVNFVDKQSTSISQMVNDILRDAKIDVTKDMATCLLSGMSEATNNFSSHSVNAQTFKAAGYLLEKGAERRTFPRQQPPLAPGMQMQGANGQGGMNTYMPPAQQGQDYDSFPDMLDDELYADDFYDPSAPGVADNGVIAQSHIADTNNQQFSDIQAVAPVPSQPQQQNQPQQQFQTQQRAQPQLHPLPQQGQMQVNTPQVAQNNTNNHQNKASQNPASDWLKPKIFKGNSRV